MRQSVLVAADMDLSSEEESEHAALPAYRNAKRKAEVLRREDGDAKKSEKKGRGDGKALHGFNRHTGVRNRRFECNSEYHFAPN